MINELKKSIGNILYERLTSPLAGTFFLTWFIWNWRIPYFLIFSDSSIKLIERIAFVETNYFSIKTLFWLPAGYTLLVLVLYPVLSLGSYFIWAYFNYFKNKIKNHVEKNTLLSQKESIELTIKYEQLKNWFSELLQSKDREIETLKLNIREYEKGKEVHSTGEFTVSNDLKEKEWEKEFDKFKNESLYVSSFNAIAQHVNAGHYMTKDRVEIDAQNYYLGNEIIKPTEKSGIFVFTDKGRYFQKRMTS